MEEFLKIPTDDDHLIYGTLNYKSDSKRDKLIIFVHGLTGNQQEHYYYNGVSFFNSEGYDVFRFDLYSRNDNGRRLSEAPIRINVSDLNLILNKFSGLYNEIILIGHSLGCIAIIRSDLSKVNQIVLWDPAVDIKSLESKKIKLDASGEKYILDWSKEIFIGKELVDEWMNFSLKEYGSLIETDVNLFFIFAEKANKYDKMKDLLSNGSFDIVDGATHRFVEEGVLNELFRKTLFKLRQ